MEAPVHDYAKNKFCVLTVEQLKGWCDDKFNPERVLEMESAEAKELSQILAAAAYNCGLIPSELKQWEFTSLIFRNTRAANANSYTNTVHRDLDQVAINCLLERGHSRCINFWVPLAPVESDPLAILHPSTVDIEREATGFLGLENNWTSLCHQTELDVQQGFVRRQWLWIHDLVPGDVLVWESGIVFHASFQLGNVTRLSTDVRLEFGE
jgi:hypothetical protein